MGDAANGRYCYLVIEVAVGSFQELEGESGLAHYTEHMNMCFQKYRMKKDHCHYRAIANTEYYCTNYVIAVEEKSLDIALGFAEDIRCGKYICEEYMEDVRRDILKEYEVKKRDFENNFVRKLLEHTEYEGREPIGEKKQIEVYTVSEVRGFFQKWYTPENFSMCLVRECDGGFSRQFYARAGKYPKQTLIKWHAREIKTDGRERNVRIAYRILLEKMERLCGIDDVLYEFLADAIGELLLYFLKRYGNFSRCRSENQILSGKEDIWWIDFAGIQDRGRDLFQWSMLQSCFMDWLQENWEAVRSEYRRMAVRYERYVTVDYYIQKVKEELVYQRAFTDIYIQKQRIGKFIESPGSLDTALLFARVVFYDSPVVMWY